MRMRNTDSVSANCHASVSAGAKEGTTYELYIALSVMDFFLFIFAVLLLYGNELSGVRASLFKRELGYAIICYAETFNIKS